MTKMAATLLTVLSATGFYALGADAKIGQAAYEKSCKGCHGAAGAPNPAIEKAFSVTMPDLSSAHVQSQSDDDLKKVIAEGKGKMKPVKNLTASPDDVIAYVRTLKK
jgi:mono/diheme cytochrome c family protein